KSAEPLQPSRPGGGIDSSNNVFFGDPQTLGGSNRYCNIFKLMAAEKLRPQIRIAAEVCAAHEPTPRPIANNRQVCGWPDDDRLARLDDAGLFGGNSFDSRSQELLMIYANARDDRDVLIDDIRRIHPPSHTDFEAGEPHAIAKVGKFHCRYEPEV